MAGTQNLSSSEVLKFWEDPKNRNLIINAKPLACLNEQDMLSILKDDATILVKDWPASHPIAETGSVHSQKLDGLQAPSSSETAIAGALSQTKSLFSSRFTSKDDNPKSDSKTTMAKATPKWRAKECETSRPNWSSTQLTSVATSGGGEYPSSGDEEPAVDSLKLRDGPVDLLKLRDGPVDLLKLRDGPVDLVKLKDYPYQSIGKLFWCFPIIKKVWYSSAYYIGDERIVTAAHTFDDSPELLLPKDAIFVPAMKDKTDTDGALFGYYEVIDEPQIHQDFAGQSSSAYDICIVKIGNGKKADGTPRYSIQEASEHELQPILLKDPTPLPQRNSDMLWEVVGYPEQQNINCVMMNFRGTYECVKGAGNERVLVMTPAMPKGVSGGPWLNAGSAIGMQSSSCFEDGTSSSPYFSKELWDRVLTKKPTC